MWQTQDLSVKQKGETERKSKKTHPEFKWEWGKLIENVSTLNTHKQYIALYRVVSPPQQLRVVAQFFHFHSVYSTHMISVSFSSCFISPQEIELNSSWIKAKHHSGWVFSVIRGFKADRSDKNPIGHSQKKNEKCARNGRKFHGFVFNLIFVSSFLFVMEMCEINYCNYGTICVADDILCLATTVSFSWKGRKGLF